MQRSVASANRKRTIRFADLKQRRYWLPLSVLGGDFEDSVYVYFILSLRFRNLFFQLSHVMQIGIGLLILQQLSGINGVLFYSSTIFASAGK